jgi:hypothetical protein
MLYCSAVPSDRRSNAHLPLTIAGQCCMAPQRHMIEANEQLALLCSCCGGLLVTVTEQAAQQCRVCQAELDTASATTSSRRPHTTAVRLSSSAPAPEQQPAPPRPRRRRRPGWIYESSRDDLLALFAVYVAVFGHEPLEGSLLDDSRTLRDVQHLYATVVDQYFDADAPYGINRTGILRWIEERWRQPAQQRLSSR